ncbi:hypothetical protein OSTOST_22202 [Ostertagia ostertagi]
MKEGDQKEHVSRLSSQLEDMEKEKDEFLEERESLLYELESLKRKLSSESGLLEEQKSAAGIRIKELIREDDLKADNDKHVQQIEFQLRESYELERKSIQDQYRQMKDDFHQAIEKVHTLTEEKATADSLVDRLRQEITDKQHQVPQEIVMASSYRAGSTACPKARPPSQGMR